MKNILNSLKENLTLVVAFISFFGVEWILKCLTNLSGMSLISFLGTLSVFVLLFGFYFCFHKKGKWVYATFVVLVMATLAFCQVVHIDYFGAFFSFSKASVLEEFWGVKHSSLGRIQPVYFTLFIFPIITFISGFWQSKTSVTMNKRSKLICSIALELGAMALFGFNKFGIDMYSQQRETGDDYLYKTLYAKPRAVQRFGFYLYEYRDFTRTLFGDGNNNSNLNESLEKFSYQQETNDYTGIFKDKNVILILAESLSEYVIDPQITPTLYKMATEGISFSNHYAPVMQAATSDSEMMALTGLMCSVDFGVTAHDYKHNSFPMSLPFLFNAKGYVSTAFHGFQRSFYLRDIWMDNYGFDAFYGEEDLYFEKKEEFIDAYNWNLDVDTFTQGVDITDDLITKKPFFDYFISVSGHMPYDTHRYELEPYLYSVYNTFGEPSDQGHQDLYAYYAAQKTLDSALSAVLENLTHRGLLEDTVIIIFGDHYPYGLSDDGQTLLFGDDVDTVKQYRTPFIIYNCNGPQVSVDKVTSTQDIYPTIANLFGLDIRDTFVMGKDALSDTRSPVIFFDRSWLSDQGYYDATSASFTPSSAGVNQASIDDTNRLISEKVDLSQELLQQNYYGNY